MPSGRTLAKRNVAVEPIVSIPSTRNEAFRIEISMTHPTFIDLDGSHTRDILQALTVGL
jgi:hypothetical protein